MKTKLLSILLILFAFNAKAQWTQTNGPEGGHMLSLATDGTNLYAGARGVFLSTNNGNS